MNKNIVWSLLFVLAFIVGCDDENDPFAGNDNFITSFSLRQGEQVYPAFFRGDTILLVTPEGISLQNVKYDNTRSCKGGKLGTTAIFCGDLPQWYRTQISLHTFQERTGCRRDHPAQHTG